VAENSAKELGPRFRGDERNWEAIQTQIISLQARYWSQRWRPASIEAFGVDPRASSLRSNAAGEALDTGM
jgi:hypothetical protein